MKNLLLLGILAAASYWAYANWQGGDLPSSMPAAPDESATAVQPASPSLPASNSAASMNGVSQPSSAPLPGVRPLLPDCVRTKLNLLLPMHSEYVRLSELAGTLGRADGAQLNGLQREIRLLAAGIRADMRWYHVYEEDQVRSKCQDYLMTIDRNRDGAPDYSAATSGLIVDHILSN